MATKGLYFSTYAASLSGGWMLFPSTFDLPQIIRIAILSDPAATGVQPMQVLEFTAVGR